MGSTEVVGRSMIELMDSRSWQSGQRKLGGRRHTRRLRPFAGCAPTGDTPANAHVTRKAQGLTEPLQSTLEPRHLHAPLPQPRRSKGTSTTSSASRRLGVPDGCPRGRSRWCSAGSQRTSGGSHKAIAARVGRPSTAPAESSSRRCRSPCRRRSSSRIAFSRTRALLAQLLVDAAHLDRHRVLVAPGEAITA